MRRLWRNVLERRGFNRGENWNIRVGVFEKCVGESQSTLHSSIKAVQWQLYCISRKFQYHKRNGWTHTPPVECEHAYHSSVIVMHLLRQPVGNNLTRCSLAGEGKKNSCLPGVLGSRLEVGTVPYESLHWVSETMVLAEGFVIRRPGGRLVEVDWMEGVDGFGVMVGADISLTLNKVCFVKPFKVDNGIAEALFSWIMRRLRKRWDKRTLKELGF